MSRATARNSGWRIFRWPLAIAFVSIVGLLSALLGDGAADALSWLLLGGIPLALLLLYRRGR